MKNKNNIPSQTVTFKNKQYTGEIVRYFCDGKTAWPMIRFKYDEITHVTTPFVKREDGTYAQTEI